MHLVLQIQRDVSKDAYLLGWTASILGHHGWRELQETTSQVVARSGKEHCDQFTLGNRNDEDALVAGDLDTRECAGPQSASRHRPPDITQRRAKSLACRSRRHRSP